MKKLFLIVALSTLWAVTFAQTPQAFKYQAVARDGSGVILANKSVSFKISILDAGTSGVVVYSEIHTGKTTNGYGLVDLEIGGGTPVSGTFSSIHWGAGNYYVKIEMDPSGGISWQTMGVSPLLSVPYALHAKTVENGFSGNYNDLINKPAGTKIGDMLYWGGSKWELVPPGLNGQILKMMNGIPVWSAGPPMIGTLPVGSITPTDAVCGGNVISDAGDSITSRGVCWSTSPNPTIADSKIYNGSGKGSFTSNITGLTSNTLYYIRAFAINSQGTGYGTQLTFTTGKTISLATVTTDVATAVTPSSAILGGNVTSDGNSAVTERGIVYGNLPDPSVSDFKVTIGSGTGAFSKTISGLASNTLYYVKAYAINGKGTSYGPQISFTTGILVTLPTVVTLTATGISETKATLGGNVTSDGNSPVTERGVVYSTLPNPTVASGKVVIGSGTGSFTKEVTGLSGSTTYYVRAYAVNIQGTAYGTQISFQTSEATTGTFTDSRDNRIYQWVKIGTQVWMGENLAYLPSVNPASASSDTIKYYYVFGYNGTDVPVARTSDNFSVYGVLYNWAAARTACPSGWHLPTDAEWKQMEKTLGMTQEQVDAGNWRGTNQGAAMKSASLWYSNGNGTNTSGFKGLPGGYRYNPSGFSGTGLLGYWWTATEYSSVYSWHRSLYYDFSTVYRGTDAKSTGYSVRCLKD